VVGIRRARDKCNEMVENREQCFLDDALPFTLQKNSTSSPLFRRSFEFRVRFPETCPTVSALNVGFSTKGGVTERMPRAGCVQGTRSMTCIWSMICGVIV
jgi:hypothetical protein